MVIDEHKFHAEKLHTSKRKVPIRITPPLPQDQIKSDLELCRILIEGVLDPEKKIESFIFGLIDKFISKIDESDEFYENLQKFQLDMLLLYL